ncbi:MAG: hypothetical protein H7250_10390 [Flavobacterium sp.]|nr:hypothetical protein [Flavobacterium sp.]
MKKINFLKTIFLFAVATTATNAQQITGSSSFSPSSGGARILSAQGDTAANPAIGFQSSVSDPTTAQNDGGGGNGIFRPIANNMAFSTGSVERMRIGQSGNVGIGIQTPTAGLHVLGGQLPNQVNAVIKLERNDLSNQAGVFSLMLSGSSWPSVASSIGAGSACFKLEDPFGNTQNSDMAFSTNGISPQLILKHSGNVGIGTLLPTSKLEIQGGDVKIGNVSTPAGYKLYVEQGILTEKVKVAVATSAAWADYVFANDYKLKPLSEVESFIKDNNHLPNVPSAKELVKEGLDLGKMQATQMEKIEELTLYLIEMKKEIEVLKKENTLMKVLVSQSKN